MFPFNKQLLASTDLVRIDNNREVFIYDEYPILFAGLNKYDLPIIGSYIAHDQDADDDVVYFIHLVVSKNSYQSFAERKVSYRELLTTSDNIYIAEKNYDQKTEVYYMIATSDFPNEYLPLPESFLPELQAKPGLSYDVSLVGGLADENKAITFQASNVANSFADILALNILHLLNYRVIQKPSTAGSFKINLELQIQHEQGEQISTEKEEALISLQTSFLDYCINELHNEVTHIFFRDDISNAPKYSLLKNKLIETHRILGKRKPLDDKKANEILTKYLRKASIKLEKAVIDMGPDFSSIKVHNTNRLYEDNLISDISHEVKSNIERTAIFIKSDGLEITEDEDYKEYTINIYNLNTDTRIGNAVLFFGNEEHKEMSRPRIKIEGTSRLEHSKYTESLHSGKSVEVNAIGKRVNNKFLTLQIAEE
jgi:hypothetical protein